MKNYTSIEQSKKLLELGIDPLTSDMCYKTEDVDYAETEDDYVLDLICRPYSEYLKFVGPMGLSYEAIPCWSLGALLNFLPSKFTKKGKYSKTTYSIRIRKYALTEDVDVYQIAYGNYHWHEDGSCSWSDMINTGEKVNLIDAVFHMIIWLKENNKL